MSLNYKRWFRYLNLSRASGQLIFFILVPMGILLSTGAWIIYYETKQSYLDQQQDIAHGILSYYQSELRKLPQISHHTKHDFLQKLLSEKNVQAVGLFGEYQQVDYLGTRLPTSELQGRLNQLSATQDIIDIETQDHQHYYAISLPNTTNQWLVIGLNDANLSIAQYRVMLILAIMIFVILLFLIFTLYFYSRFWLSPLYKLRIQLQRLESENLTEFKRLKSTEELDLLQQDLQTFIQRMHQHFVELREYAQETENDTRNMLDRVEIQSVGYRNELKKVMSINQSKSIFLANISHELRTPLNSIEGFVQLLLRQKNLNADQRLYLETIKKSSAHLLAVINDVLDYSKIEAGKLQLELAPFNLENAMFDVIDMLSPLASQKDIHLVFYFPTEVPTQVLGDELRFKQILTNLVSNAIKFTPDGEVIVRVRLERWQDKECQLYFTVQDSGIGISGSEKSKLFESFTQADTSVTRQYGGTGLGLAISKQLVQLMQGAIGFKDNPAQVPTEKGTTFWFTATFQALVEESQHVPIRYPQLKILSYLQHPATASALRYYVEHLSIQHKEAISVFDLFDQLNSWILNEQDWLIVDYTPDIEASLKQIRQRYSGNLAIYGYQMSLNLELLNQYEAYPLYQPVNRQALLTLLNQQMKEKDIVPTAVDGRHLHLLAVDDHLPNLMVLEALLQEFNIQLDKALSGHEALQKIQQRAEQGQELYDLIFMDIQMPVMSGIDTTRAIRSFESTLKQDVRMPIIALSAHIFSDEKQKILESGMDGDISKPIRLEQMVYILQKWTKLFDQQTESAVRVEPSMNDMRMQGQGNNTLSEILDWQMSLNLAANKADLALDLLTMLVAGFEQDCREIQELIELEDFPQLEYVLHRIYGATRYVGVPRLQQLTGAFEQFCSQLRKQNQKADEVFAREVMTRFEELKQCMQLVKASAEQLKQSLN